MQRVIGQSGEIKALVRVESHGLAQHSEVHRFESSGTLGHNNDIGTIFSDSGSRIRPAGSSVS